MLLTFSREERRWMEKQNKTTRQKRKKDEMTRIRTLVGTVFVYCMNLIPWHTLSLSLPLSFPPSLVYRQCLQLRPTSKALQGAGEGRESCKEEGKEGSSQAGGSGERESKMSLLWWYVLPLASPFCSFMDSFTIQQNHFFLKGWRVWPARLSLLMKWWKVLFLDNLTW